MVIIQHHNAGLCNQILNLEIAAGIALLSGKAIIDVVTPFVERPSSFFDKAAVSNRDTEPLYILDIMEIPDWIDLTTSVVPINYDEATRKNIQHLFINASPGTPVSESFADGREELDLVLEPTLGHPSIAYYSITFANRTKELDRTLAAVRPKAEYRELADKIAQAIGPFNGVHLRRGDHIGVVDVPGSMIEQATFRDWRPLVLATDEPDAEGIPKDAIIIEEYIINNFWDEFNRLPRRTSDVFALICNLVMHHSKDFYGTQTSTYTGYIQRAINQRDPDFKFKYLNNDIAPSFTNGEYSWNLYDGPGIHKTILREWPESKLDI